MLAIQIILIVLFSIIILKIILRFRAGELNWKEMLFWLMFWCAAALIAAKPDSTFYLARKVGIGRGADLIVYAGLVLLFFMVFGLTVKLEKINKNITKLTRKAALENNKSEARSTKHEARSTKSLRARGLSLRGGNPSGVESEPEAETNLKSET